MLAAAQSPLMAEMKLVKDTTATGVAGRALL
jgi:hypothetical protein